MRILMGAYGAGFAAVRLPHHLDLARLEVRRFEPIGIWSALSSPLPVWVVLVLGLASVATGVMATVGWRYRLSGPAFAMFMLALITYGNCWGQVLHTEHLMVLHLGVLAISPAADRWSLDQRARRVPGGDGTTTLGHRWAIWLMAAATAATYFVAGYAKWRNGGVEWITGDVLRAQIAHDNLRKELLGDIASPFAAAILPHRWLFPPLAGLSLLFEVGAPLVLLVRPLRRVWLIGIVGFHWGVLAFMAVLFPYQLAFLAFLPHLFLLSADKWPIPDVRNGALL